MDEQVNAYIEYIGNMRQLTKPNMPKFDLSAYTENEYVKEIRSLEKEFENTDSVDLTIAFLKGE